MTEDEETDEARFARLAARERPAFNTARDLAAFLASTKRYWLVPIVLTMLLFAALFALSSTAAAPFIYTFF